MQKKQSHQQRAQQAWSKKVYLLPNLFTTANMFCGFSAIISAIHGKYIQASWSLLAAMLFDSMDGRVARMTRSTSDFGLQYDSLSDLVSFGLSPAILMYTWALQPYGRLGWLATFLYVVCAALRLARFNVMVNVVPKGFFQGIPSPLAACTVATSILFYRELSLDKWISHKDIFVLPILFTTATLMISNIPFPSFKEVKMKRENSFQLLALIVLVLTLIAVRPELTIFVMSVLYILGGLGYELFCIVFRRERLVADSQVSSTP